MHATEILSNHFELYDKDLEDDIEEVCIMCGEHITKGIKKKKVMSSNFTDYDECREVSSEYICLNCATCVKERDLRTHNFLADKTNIYLFKKKDLEKYLFNLEDYVQGEFVIGITTSFKKHNSFRCKVNNNTERVYIREEDKEYILEIAKAKKLFKILNDMYLFFTKDEILSGQYPIIKIENYGLEQFNKNELELRKYRTTHQFNLLVYMLDSEKRNAIVKEKINKAKELKTKNFKK